MRRMINLTPMIGDKYMWREKTIIRLIVLYFSLLSLLASCKAVTPIVSPPIIGSTTSSEPISSTPTPIVTGKATLELTYVTSCDGKYDCMMAVEIGCLESNLPCVGKSRLLFKLSDIDNGPKPPILSPDWSTDGQQVTIQATGTGGDSDIFVGDFDGKNWINLTNSPNFENNPLWSPDNRRIIYTGKTDDPENYLRTYSISRDGKGIQRLLARLDMTLIDISNFSWPSDFSRIAFLHSDDHGFTQVYVSDLEGDDLVQLTNDKVNHLAPRFSPDGKWIVFLKEPQRRPLIRTLFLIRSDGMNEESLTREEQGSCSQAVWSPDSNWIAFGKDDNGLSNIYMIKKDGTGFIQVTNSNKDAIFPAWRLIVP